MQPDYAEVHFNLGVALADRKQHEEAIACYERALQVRPDYVDAMYNLGLLLVHERRSADAVAMLQHAVRLKPHNPEAHNNLSLAFADLGRFDDAVASCDAALTLRPLDRQGAHEPGQRPGFLRADRRAPASYALALRLQPDYVNAHWNRAPAARQGHRDEEQAHMQIDSRGVDLGGGAYRRSAVGLRCVCVCKLSGRNASQLPATAPNPASNAVAIWSRGVRPDRIRALGTPCRCPHQE